MSATKKEMNPTKKAWRLNPAKIHEDWYYTETIVYAENEKKARVLLLKDVRCTNLELTSKKPVTYITIPIKRYFNADKFLYKGQELTIYDINRAKISEQRNEWLKRLLDDPKVEWCYIKKGGYYYRENSKGYSEYELSAGIYDKQAAVSHALGCEELTIIPIDVIKHNIAIQEEIKQLSKRLIYIP